MCNSLRSAAPIRGRQSNRDADMLEILQSGGNKLRNSATCLAESFFPASASFLSWSNVENLCSAMCCYLPFKRWNGGQEAPIPRSHMLDQTVA